MDHFIEAFSASTYVNMTYRMASFNNTSRPKQNGRRFAHDVFKCIFLNEKVWISLNISLKFVPKVPNDTIPALVQVMAWRCSGDKPLSELMMVGLLMHICVTRPQWINDDRTNETGTTLRNISCGRKYDHLSSTVWMGTVIEMFMMASSNGNIFRVTGPLCGEFTCLRWIQRTKACDAELWCFLWSVPN